MTVLEAIKNANKCAGIRTFVFADLRTTQSFFDSFKSEDSPFHCMVPFENRGTWKTGRRASIAPIQGWVIQRIGEDTNNWRHEKVESDYLEPMRAKAKSFLISLISSDIADPEVDNITDIIRPEYMFLNQHLFGVSYSVNLPLTESAC
jgi:hypothetical protein